MTVAHFCKELASEKLIKATSYDKCYTVVRLDLQEADMCDSLTLVHILSKGGTVPMQPCMRGPAKKGKLKHQLREGSGEHTR